jgi:hypothetical protein
MTDQPHYTEGVCGDGAAILRDGVMMPIEDVVSELNRLTTLALAQPAPEGPTDEELLDAAADSDMDRFEGERSYPDGTVINEGFWEAWDHQLLAFTRAVLARWGTPNPAEVRRSLVEPADAEVAELVEWLQVQAAKWTELGREALAQQFTRCTAALLQHHHPPQPVPVSERLPGPGDWDRNGRCWLFDPCDHGWWSYRGALPSDGDPAPFTHWLPFHALPIPRSEND